MSATRLFRASVLSEAVSSKIGFEEVEEGSEIFYDTTKGVTPELYGAIGNGTADDSDFVEQAFNTAVTLGSIVLSKVYKVTKKIVIDADGNDITIYSNKNSRIVFPESLTELGSYWTPTSALLIKNARNVIVNGVAFVGGKTEGGITIANAVYAKSGVTESHFHVLQIENSKNVELRNVYASGGDEAGIHIRNCESAFLSNCTCVRNRYAGASFVGVGHTTVIGGEYSCTGDTSTPYSYGGYGIAWFGQSGTGKDNQNITVIGAKFCYNLRKGIDAHGGVNITFTGNTVIGYLQSGIYAVYEPGNTPNGTMLGDQKIVRNVKITGNFIYNDAAWFSAIPFPTNYHIGLHGIQAGNFQRENGLRTSDSGDTLIENNTITGVVLANSTLAEVLAYYPINYCGGQSDTGIIKGNTITAKSEVTCKAGIYVSGEFSGPDENTKYYNSDGTEVGQVKRVEIIGNRIFNHACGEQVIEPCTGDSVIINDNYIVGCRGANAISAFGYYGGKIKKIQINRNEIHGTYTYAGINYYSTFPATINDNILECTSPIGIKVRSADLKASRNELNGVFGEFGIDCGADSDKCTSAMLKDNIFSANCAYPINIATATVQTMGGNCWLKQVDGARTSFSLPDFTGHNAGTLRSHIETSTIESSADWITKELLTVDTDLYESGVAQFDVVIRVTCANNQFRARYELSAYAGNDQNDTAGSNGDPVFGIDANYKCNYDNCGTAENTPEALKPTLKWNGKYNERTLYITCKTQYTSYDIEIKFAGWRLMPTSVINESLSTLTYNGDTLMDGECIITLEEKLCDYDTQSPASAKEYCKGTMQLDGDMTINDIDVMFDILSGGVL